MLFSSYLKVLYKIKIAYNLCKEVKKNMDITIKVAAKIVAVQVAVHTHQAAERKNTCNVARSEKSIIYVISNLLTYLIFQDDRTKYRYTKAERL